MGALGRDLSFWLFLASAFIGLFWISWVPAIAAELFTLLFFYHFLTERPRAIRLSEKKGLKIAVLVPLTRPVARLHLLLARRKIAGKWVRAYEIHVPGFTGPEYVKLLDEDLNLIKKTFPRPALYFWEAAAPVPARIRRFIRDREKDGKAYWIKGPTPVPKVFGNGFSLSEKKHVRRGAILLEGGVVF